MIKACIFDCDGTLLDTLVSIAWCANRALHDYGLDEIPVEAYKYMVGDGARVLIQRCIEKNQASQEEYFENVFARYREYFKVDCMYEVKPYDGIPELVKALRKRGILTAVLSNKPHQETIKVIRDTFEEEDFDKILGFLEEIPKKPAPDGALLVAEELNVAPEECLYIGDTNTDMQTGNGAGMNTVGVLWGFRDREELEANHAKHIASEPKEIMEIISAYTK